MEPAVLSDPLDVSCSEVFQPGTLPLACGVDVSRRSSKSEVGSPKDVAPQPMYDYIKRPSEAITSFVIHHSSFVIFPGLFGGRQLLFGFLIIFAIIVPIGLIIFVVSAITVFSIQVYLIDDTAQDCTMDIHN